MTIESGTIGPAYLGGPYCENGDVLIEGLVLSDGNFGWVIALMVSGAYQLSMRSNYIGARKPAVIMVESGKARLIQRWLKNEDLTQRDIPL